MCYFCGNTYAYYLSLITKTTHGLQRSKVNLWVEQFTRFGCFCWINVTIEKKKKSVGVGIINRAWSQNAKNANAAKHVILAILLVCRVNLDMGLCFGVNSELLRFLVKDTHLNGLFKIIYGISWKRFERFARRACNLKVVDKGLHIVYGEACFTK